MVEALCQERDLEILEQRDIPYGRQFKIQSGTAAAQLNVYFGKKGLTLVSQGADNAAKAAIEELAAVLKGGKGSERKVTKEEKEYPEVAFAYDEPWIGTDESGKGDYFGGLVTAGVIVDPEAIPLLRSLGVDDSKKITDSKIASMAAEIRKICFGKYKVLSLLPSKYNDLYERMKGEGKNLNSLLAWAHVSVLENLLEVQMVKLAIADKFADETYMNDRLKKLGRTIQLIQVPKAEQNIAVAAASILARDAFLRWHQEAKEQYGVTFPKGVSSEVVRAGREYVQSYGVQSLRNVAKVHFKTTSEVLAERDS
jgi:ribonuclease HIII